VSRSALKLTGQFTQQKIIYQGSNAANVKWVGRLIPMWLYDMILVRMLGLGHLPGLLQEALKRNGLHGVAKKSV
jgi:hypothetical protein